MILGNVASRVNRWVWIALKARFYLLFSAVMAAALKIRLNPDRVADFMKRHQKMGVIGATATAVATPLCSCGTTAVALGMIANFVPLAPVVSFLAASPLTSPEELVYSAGLFGWGFAWTFWISSIFVGITAGTIAAVVQRSGGLSNQITTIKEILRHKDFETTLRYAHLSPSHKKSAVDVLGEVFAKEGKAAEKIS